MKPCEPCNTECVSTLKYISEDLRRAKQLGRKSLLKKLISTEYPFSWHLERDFGTFYY